MSGINGTYVSQINALSLKKIDDKWHILQLKNFRCRFSSDSGNVLSRYNLNEANQFQATAEILLQMFNPLSDTLKMFVTPVRKHPFLDVISWFSIAKQNDTTQNS